MDSYGKDLSKFFLSVSLYKMYLIVFVESRELKLEFRI